MDHRLASFAARNGAPAAERLHVAGRAYAEGRLSVAGVAGVLGVSVPDAVAALEQHGVARSTDAIRLPDAERAAFLGRVASRTKRDQPSRPDEDAVARDVIATQRIEGVDARPWLPRG